MISRFSVTLCAGIIASLSFLPAVHAVDLTPVPVASYPNELAVIEKEGKRVATILAGKTYWAGDQHFDKDYWERWVIKHQTGSAVVLFSPKSQSSEARLLLARAIKAEGLRIILRGDDAKSVTVQSILEQDKPK